jgi:hypothetical protein
MRDLTTTTESDTKASHSRIPMGRGPVSWIAAAALLAADLFLHKPITDICDAWVVRYGWATYNRRVFFVLASTSIGAALALAAREWRRWLRPSAIAALVALSALTCAAYKLLMIANIELIHFPQYALMTGVLMAGGNSVGVAWAAAVAAGVIDETYQQLVIYAGRPDTYLDFNDMVFNAIGATWVVLLVWAGRRPAPTTLIRWFRPGWRPVVLLAAALIVLFWLDPPTLSPFWRRARTGRDYRVLSAVEGLLATVLLWGVARLGMTRGPG